jgi:hypothetical protein
MAEVVGLELRKSSQNIPLKGRSDSPDPAEFWPQRLFTFELRCWGYAARASCQDLSRDACAGVDQSLRWQDLPRFRADPENDAAAANPAAPLHFALGFQRKESVCGGHGRRA